MKTKKFTKQEGFTPHLECAGDSAAESKWRIPSEGFTLLETLIGITIFSIIAFTIYFAYSGVLNMVAISKFDLTMLTLLDNGTELIRNMPYEDIGVIGGSPSGKLLAAKTVILDGVPFNIDTTVRNIDDPFDGTIGGTPNDLAPADYRLVEITASCASCSSQYKPVIITTNVAPKNLENSTNNGALFINVFDASGSPVSNANVSVANNLVNPQINTNDVTNINGMLQLVDIATSSMGYQITVSKNGHSTERTYSPGGVDNPNPTKPNATVAKQQVTQISFAIDRLSALNFRTANQFCQNVPNINFSLSGSKLIGADPNVLKFSVSSSTNASGLYSYNNLEWDTYNFLNTDPDYDIGGTFNGTSLVVNPAQTYDFKWLMDAKDPMVALVSVLDSAGQPVNDAKITLSKSGFSRSLYSGRRTYNQSDWSGGRFSSKSANIEVDNPSGLIELKSIGGKYTSNSQEWLISQTVDFGASDTRFYYINWMPNFQPPAAGPDSFGIQIATNNDDATWNFTGPDGTPDSYYTASDSVINPMHNGQRYLRYKVFLKTIDDGISPQLDDINIEFHSSCVPENQSYFGGLTSGAYTILVEKDGFQTLTDSAFSISKNWQEYRAILIPN